MPMQTSSLLNDGWITEGPVEEVGSLGSSSGAKRSYLPRITSLALAVTATMTSCIIAMFSAWERGGTLAEQLVYSAFASVVLFGVHLLPTLSRGQSLAVRMVVAAVCAAGFVATLSGQIAFYLFAQQHAGARRAESVPDAATAFLPANSMMRDLTAIARDQAAERMKLALIDRQRCGGACAGARRRRAAIIATLDELRTEADEAKRREFLSDRQAALDDRTMRLRDAMRADPVASRLSGVTGIDGGSLNLLLSLIYASVLDGIGVLGWYFALSGHCQDDRVACFPSAVIANGKDSDPLLTNIGSDSQLAQLMRDVAGGKLKATVAGIRNYLGCSQQKATKLRRELAARGVVIDRNSGGRHGR